jgi:hypothetical protein
MELNVFLSSPSTGIESTLKKKQNMTTFLLTFVYLWPFFSPMNSFPQET